MATHYQTETIFDYTWKQVAQAYWHRYPNPSSTHVLSEDTISREVRDGKLYSRRLLSKTNSVPKWGERFYKNTPVKIVEDSVLDPKEKTLITFTRNIGFKKIMRVDEIVEYKEHQDGRTIAIRRAYISSGVFGFSRAIRAFGIERFKSNCNKTSSGFNFVLRNMFPHHHQVSHQGGKGNVSHFTHALEAATSNAASVKSEIAQQQQHSHGISKTEALKKAAKGSYEYCKSQAAKLAQVFSIKN